MKERRYHLVLRHQHRPGGNRSLVSLNEIARQCQCHPETVEKFMRFGLLEPVEDVAGAPLFAPTCVGRLRRALRLRRDLGVNAHSLLLVLELIERIEHLEDELARLKS